MQHLHTSWRLMLAAVLLLSSCGPMDRQGPGAIAHRPPPGELEPATGVITRAQISRIVEDQRPGFNNCLRRAKSAFISGEVHLRFLVDHTGRVNSVYVVDSDLGSWRAEQCLVETARFLEFPAPNGDDYARFDYAFTSNESGRRLAQLKDEAWGYTTLRKHRRVFDACRKAHDFEGPFHLTIYVGRRGQVLSAGFHANAPADGLAACAVQFVEGLKFPDPGARTVKYRALIEDLRRR